MEVRGVQPPLLSLGLITCVAGVAISTMLPVSWVEKSPSADGVTVPSCWPTLCPEATVHPVILTAMRQNMPLHPLQCLYLKAHQRGNGSDSPARLREAALGCSCSTFLETDPGTLGQAEHEHLLEPAGRKGSCLTPLHPNFI